MKKKILQSIFWLTLSVILIGVTHNASANTAICDLGPTNSNTSMNETTPLVADGETVGATDLACNHRDLLAPTGDDHYFYFQISDSFAYQGNHPTSTVVLTYYDTTGSVVIRLQYDAITSAYKTHATTITTGGTNTWKNMTWTLTDAYYGNRENGSSDIRINVMGTAQAHLDKITVTDGIADTQAPTVPTNLAGTAVAYNQINLSWTASTDNVGVTGYKVYRNTALLGSTAATSYNDSGLSGNTTYTYAVSAYDAAGNNSAQCSPITVTTPSQPPTPTGIPTPPATGGLTVSCDLAATNVNNYMQFPIVIPADGDTAAGTVAGRTERHQAAADDYYMYFNITDSIVFQGNHTTARFYIDYYDVAGSFIQVQYDSTSNAFQNTTQINTTGTNTWKCVEFDVTDAYFGNRTNGSDFRISIGNVPIINLDKVRVWIAGATTPPATGQLYHKILCGYQGWFRCPNDGTSAGWRHWSKSTSTITPTNYSIDEWPDMSSYTSGEKYRAGTILTKGGAAAYLFSSANAATVNRHFAWMQQYGIDGIFLQRFLPIPTGDNTVLANVKSSATTYGRLWTVEWDTHNLTNSNLYSSIRNDWIYLVDTAGIKTHSKVMKENNKVVIAVYGLALTSLGFTSATANSVVDFLKSDPTYGGNYVYGGVPANWNSTSFSSAWSAHFDKYDAIQAWMPNSADCSKDIARCNSKGQAYFGHVWPGFSNAHLKNYAPLVPPYTDRQGGTFLTTKSDGLKISGCDRMFVGMFDECDESTAIFPMTDDHPNPRSSTQGYFIDNQGQPSDHWMTLAGNIW